MVHPRTWIESFIDLLGELFIILSALILQNIIFNQTPTIYLGIGIILTISLIGAGVVLRRHSTRISEWIER